MRIINDRYLVESIISTGDDISCYLVNNTENNEKYILNIIETKVLNDKLKEHLISDIAWIKNLNFHGVINLYDIIPIESIDGIKPETRKYAYITENISEYTTKALELHNSTELKVDLFSKTLSIVNTLRLMGYVYDKLNINNIYYMDNGTVKLQDILSIEIEKLNTTNNIIENNIELNEKTKENHYKLNELIYLFYSIFEKELHEDNIRDRRVSLLYKKLIDKVFSTFDEVIDYINVTFNKKYNKFCYETLNKVNDEVSVIGREYETNKFIKKVEDIVSKKVKFSITAINGDEGSGKTKLLNHFKKLIDNKFDDSVNIINGDTLIDRNISIEENKKSVFKLIQKISDKKQKEKYEVYIEDFLELVMDKEDSYILDKKNRYLKTINRITKFLSEVSKNKFTVLILDNIERKNDIVRMFLKYLCLSEISIENFLLVITYNENKIKGSADIEHLIYSLKLKKDFDEYKLNYLNEYDTRKLIKNMLNTSLELYDFSNKIFKETLGNPMYIIEIVKKLFEDKVIYIYEKTGKWKERLKDREITFPISIEEEVQKTLEAFSNISYEIMKKLSIFKNPIEENFLYTLGILNKNNDREFQMLKMDGYIGEKISDRGILYDINNNLIKKIIYRNISVEEKNKWHRDLSIFLEQEIEHGNQYEDELIYQLEILGESNKFISLCKKCGDIEFKSWNNNKSIYYYNRALESKGIGKDEYIEITLMLADLYYRSGNINETLNYYRKVLYITEDKEVKAYCYARMAAIAYRLEDANFIEEYFEECRILLDELDYQKGEVAYYLAKAKQKNFLGDYEEAVKIGLMALDIAGDDYADLVAYTYICIGDAYINMNLKDKPMECFENAKYSFEKSYNLRGIISTDLNMGQYFYRVKEDNKEALIHLFNAKKASYKYGVKDFGVLLDVTISEIYINERRYKEALELLQEALDRTDNNGLDYYRCQALFYLSKCYIKLDKLHLAYRYLEIGNEIYHRYNSQETFLKTIKNIRASYYYSISNYEKAWEVIDSNMTISKEYNGHIISRIRCEQYFYNLRRCKSEAEIRDQIEGFKLEGNNINDQYFKNDLLLDFIIELEEIGYGNIAKELYSGLEKIGKDNKLLLKYRYIQLFNANNNIPMTNEIEMLLNYLDDKKLYAKISAKIGGIHENNCDFVSAIESYYRAISVLNKTVKTLPNKYKINYINNGMILVVYNKLVRCLKVELNIEGLEEKSEIDSMLEFEDLMNELEIENLIKNKTFLVKLQEDYEKNYFNQYNSIYDVLDMFKSNIINNIEHLIKYICKLTVAEGAIVTMQDSEGIETIIYDYRAINPRIKVEFFKSKLNIEDGGRVVKLNLNKENINDEELLPKGMKAAIYLKTKNRISIGASENIQGTIILYSNKYLNNINQNALENLKSLVPLMGFLLDKYNLTIDSTIDKLTRVYNRKYFESSLLDILEYSKVQQKDFSIAYFDIDNFKGVNDKYGHHFGDKVLTSVATIAKENIDKNDIIGRYGGEEFVVLFPGKNQYEAFETCEKFRDKIQKSAVLGNGLELTISIGISQYPIHSNSGENLINMADEALYIAKNTGKNKTIIWSNEFGATSQLNDKLVGILSGNTINDYRKLSAIMDIIDLIRMKSDITNKIYEFLTRVMEMVEAQEGTLFILEDNILQKEYTRKRHEEGWQTASEFNEIMMNQVIANKTGLYIVDWDGSREKLKSSWIPDWKSILIAPIIYNGIIKGILYLSVSINEKEFNHNDLNFVNTLSGIFSAILSS